MDCNPLVVADSQLARDVLGEAAEVLAHALTESSRASNRVARAAAILRCRDILPRSLDLLLVNLGTSRKSWLARCPD